MNLNKIDLWSSVFGLTRILLNARRVLTKRKFLNKGAMIFQYFLNIFCELQAIRWSCISYISLLHDFSWFAFSQSLGISLHHATVHLSSYLFESRMSLIINQCEFCFTELTLSLSPSINFLPNLIPDRCPNYLKCLQVWLFSELFRYILAEIDVSQLFLVENFVVKLGD